MHYDNNDQTSSSNIIRDKKKKKATKMFNIIWYNFGRRVRRWAGKRREQIFKFSRQIGYNSVNSVNVLYDYKINRRWYKHFKSETEELRLLGNELPAFPRLSHRTPVSPTYSRQWIFVCGPEEFFRDLFAALHSLAIILFSSDPRGKWTDDYHYIDRIHVDCYEFRQC